MRFRGVHGRHREVRDAAFAPSPTDSRPRSRWRPERLRLRLRGDKPRDRSGRFRRVRREETVTPRPGPFEHGRDINGAARRAQDALRADNPEVHNGGRVHTRVDGRAEPVRYVWRDFELDDAPLPRAEPRPPGTPYVADGLRHCGVLERVLYRQWDARQGPAPPEVVRAVDSLAALPERLKVTLAEGLEGIYVGPGGVPALDDMGHLRDRPLPSGRATWDICAGAYGDGKIIVGDRPSPTPDVMMHEVGHALDDIDGGEDGWQSDGEEFRRLYERCLPHLAAEFHRQPDALGRREFFADAFAAISARQRPALVDMLAGNIRMALDVMLFFNRRYGI
jgi:hypothetical protein